MAKKVELTMLNYDFLFIYEIKARELENIILLKYLLEKKNYRVGIINTWYFLENPVPNIKSNVVVTFAMYDNNTFKFILHYIKNFQNIVNLQWEQIGNNYDDINYQSVFKIDGIAKNCYHVCWGEYTYNRLVNIYNIDQDKLRITGNIALDFFRSEFQNYYYGSDYIKSKMQISTDKKIILFISSFSYVGLPTNVVRHFPDVKYDVNEFIDISISSQKLILDWLEKLLIENDEYVIVYRPHPAESENNRIKELTSKYGNFKISNNYSIKQWIIASDFIYTWYSTSIAEIVASKKKYSILRPVDIPYSFELVYLNNANFLKTYNEFYKSLSSKETHSLQVSDLNKYYSYNLVPTYIKLVEFLNHVRNSKESLDRSQVNLTIFEKLEILFFRFPFFYIKRIIITIIVHLRLLRKNKILSYIEFKKYKKYQIDKHYATKEEIDNIQMKFETIFSNSDVLNHYE